MYEIRTDLALEDQEKYEADHVEIKGVRLNKQKMGEDVLITTMSIDTENGAKAMGRPRGSYVTIEASNMDDDDEAYHERLAKKLSEIIRQLLPEAPVQSVLVVGLGNRNVTSDSLGPKVVDQMFITRHMMREFGAMIFGEKQKQVSAIVPGVMAQTGMESSEIIRGILDETKPDVVVAVDALAARSTKRLNRTIQVTNTGIHPGSGVGNHRNPLNEEALGVPVLAIGIPTVVDAATIVGDTMSELLHVLSEHQELHVLEHSYHSLGEARQHELVHDLLTPQLNTMYVTAKDIDASIERLSATISHAINLAFQE